MTYKMINGSFHSREELLRMGFKAVGRDSQIHRMCNVVGAENISIGDNVRIDSFTSIIAANKGFLTLGSHIHIGSHCYIDCSAGVIMEDFSGLAYGVKVHSMSEEYNGECLTNSCIPAKYKTYKAGTIHMGKHAVVGSNSVILPNVDIPIGCSVGALSLVNKNLKEWGVYCGCPVKRMKDRSQHLLVLEESFRQEYKRDFTTEEYAQAFIEFHEGHFND